MYHCIMRDRVAALPSLTTHATYVALAPFVGPEHAAQVAIEPLPEPLS
jgi:hypothetical protein